MNPHIATERLIATAARLASRPIVLLASLVLASGTASALSAPVLVKDINPGSSTSILQSFLPLGNRLFFSATDGVNGPEPWASDATGAGTTMLADVLAGSSGGYDTFSGDPIRIGSVAYFAADDGTGGYQLWRTDGTAAGTSKVYAGTSVFDLENVGGTLYFLGTTGNLWTSDGTSGGTVQVTTNVFAQGSLTDVNGTLFFSGADVGGAYGREIWIKDGSANGASMVKDLRPGTFDNAARFLTNVNGALFFFASTGPAATDNGLCKSDGTASGTFLLKSLTMDLSQTRGQLVDANGTAFLIASNGVNGMELWKSDGTVGGTVMVKDINPGSADGFALGSGSLVAIGSTVYFAASDGVVGKELWKSDGTEAGTVLVKDIYPGFGNFGNSNPAGLANVYGKLLFRAESPSVGGQQLWTSDGTTAGTVQVAVMNPTGGNCLAQSFTAVGNNIFFSGTNGSSGVELWVMSDALTGVNPVGRGASESVTLSPNYPNPVRTTTHISYSIPAGQHVTLKLYDLSGREVQTLVNEQQSAGAHRVEMNAAALPSGAYFYRLETDAVVGQKTMLLIR